jgi:putative tryptophan/tyrosine transport system substrate-binding protein
MRRRDFITLLGSTAAAWPRAARAQQNEVKRVGWIVQGRQDPLYESFLRIFRDEMTKLGWVEGKNLRFETQFGTPGDDASVRTAAAEIVGSVPDAIVTSGTQTSLVFKQLTGTIPIVFVNVADPVASGIVARFAHPGRNVTGFTSVEFSLAGKWISILKDIAPGINRVMVLYYPDNSNWRGYLQTIEAAAPASQVKVSATPAAGADEIRAAIEAFARELGGALIVIPSGLTGANRQSIAALAIEHRLPSIYAYDYFAESGGLVSYGSDTHDLYRRAASYVDRIFMGEKPADLPVQAPTKFEMVVNLKTAKALGLAVPQTLLATADQVIE